MSHFKQGTVKIIQKTRPYGREHVKPKVVEIITLKRLTPSLRLTFHGINQDDTNQSRSLAPKKRIGT